MSAMQQELPPPLLHPHLCQLVALGFTLTAVFLSSRVVHAARAPPTAPASVVPPENFVINLQSLRVTSVLSRAKHFPTYPKSEGCI